MAVIGGIANDLPIIIKVSIFLAVGLSLWLNLKQFVFDPENITVRYSEATGWQLGCRENGYSAIDLEGSTVSTPFFIILHVKQKEGPKKTILIVNDSVSAEEFRKLRVALKITGSG